DIVTDVGLGVFRRMDAIIGCLDNRLARLYINRQSFRVGKPWINGGIINLTGQMNVFKNGHGCYECMLTPIDWSVINEKLGCPDIAKRNASAGRVPTTPLSSSIVAAMQVQEALKVIHGFDKQLMTDEQLRYEGMNNWFISYKYGPRLDTCSSHYTIPDDELIQCDELSNKSTLSETLAVISSRIGKDVTIKLDYNVILSIYLSETKEEVNVVIPELKFKEEEQTAYRKHDRDIISFQKMESDFGPSYKDSDMKLSELGIPPLQILTIEDMDGEIYFVELSKDKDYISFNKN
ncbi:MAG: HesA/MoeB/ThiF family protein, partial [Saprospiraceae bacterium]